MNEKERIQRNAEKIYTVRLIRRKEQVAIGIYQKEFWTLCGVYVCEFIDGLDDWEEEKGQMIDCNIFMDENLCEKYSGKCKAKHEVCFEVDKKKQKTKSISVECTEYQKTSNFNTKTGRLELGKILKKMLEDIGQKFMWDEKLKKEFQQISEAFIGSDYAYQDYFCHLFLPQLSEERIGNLAEMYVSCLNQLIDENRKLNGQYRLYAYINCARKYERTCDIRNKIGYFVKEELMKEAVNLTKNDPEFTSSWALAGLIGLSYYPLRHDGEFYMEKAICAESGKKHCAFLLYALGHYYEYQDESKETAYALYRRIKLVDKNNYKMFYKKATEYLKVNIELTMELYEKFKGNEEWLLPNELELFYKCARGLENSTKGFFGESSYVKRNVINNKTIKQLFEANDVDECIEMILDGMEHRSYYLLKEKKTYRQI